MSATPPDDHNGDVIPQKLRDCPQWVGWRYGETRSDGKRPKVPITGGGKPARVNDPATWDTFDAVSRAASERGFGIGFVFSADDLFVGVDLDNVVDHAGVFNPWARRIVDELDSYTEFSPSGRGVHIFVKAILPPRYGRGTRKGSIEVYSSGRFFTMTGLHVPRTPTTIEGRIPELWAVLAREIPVPSTGGEDTPPPVESVASVVNVEKLIAELRVGKDAETFVVLFDRGETDRYGGDDSEADWALCKIVAKSVVGREGATATVDTIMRQSALLRTKERVKKWDGRRGTSTYGTRTIGKALTEVAVEMHDDRIADACASEPKPLEVWRWDEIPYERIDWLDFGRFPFGDVTGVEGPGGVGKTTFVLDVIARISRGDASPSGTVPKGRVRSLIFAEEDRRSLLHAKLDAAHHDSDYVDLVKDCEFATFPANIDRLRATLESARNLGQPYGVVFLDNLANRVSQGLNINHTVELRRVLRPLADLAHEFNVAIIIIRHWRKGSGIAVERGSGSVDFVNVLRSLLTVGALPENEGRFAIALAKHNLVASAPALAYELVGTTVSRNGITLEVPIVRWLGEVDVTADELATAEPRKQDDEADEARDDAASFLRGFLAAGPRFRADVIEAARGAEPPIASVDTLKRAAQRLRIRYIREQTARPRTRWALPEQPSASQGAFATVPPTAPTAPIAPTEAASESPLPEQSAHSAQSEQRLGATHEPLRLNDHALRSNILTPPTTLGAVADSGTRQRRKWL